jgi:hypothetical protein
VSLVILEKVFESIVRNLRGAKRPDQRDIDDEIKRRCEADDVAVQLVNLNVLCEQLPILVQGAVSWEQGSPDIRPVVVNRASYIGDYPIAALPNYRKGSDSIRISGQKRRWYAEKSACDGATVMLNCDEYPYFASYETAGKLYADLGLNIPPDLQLVAAAPNQAEGRMYGNFAIRCRLAKRYSTVSSPQILPDGSTTFLLVPLPNVKASGRFCRGEIASDLYPDLDEVDAPAI